MGFGARRLSCSQARPARVNERQNIFPGKKSEHSVTSRNIIKLRITQGTRFPLPTKPR